MTVASAVAQESKSEERPNFIIIMADDMGYGDPGCFGGHIETPHLDRMAKEGLKLTDFHSNGSVCSPSRAALLTGRYQQRCGIDGIISADPSTAAHQLGLDSSLPTLPRIMADGGYKTALFGKWHLGYKEQFHPMNFGFDRFVGYVAGNIDYHSHYDRMGAYDWWHGREQVKEEGYSTHLITKHAVDYIHKNKDNPFCIYVAHEAVHSPLQGPKDPIQRGPNRVEAEPRSPEEVFKDMFQELDKGVGEVLAAVKDAGLSEKTFVLFTSDNGPMPQSSPGALRGRKGSIYEGGHRVPTVAWWPGVIQPGTLTDETGIFIDILPTLTDLAGIDTGNTPLDGVSLKPVLTGESLTARKLYWRNSGLSPHAKDLNCQDSHKAIRDGKWKLVASPYYEELELFDLEKDLSETTDLSGRYPDRVKTMEAELLCWEKEVSVGLPYRICPAGGSERPQAG